MIEQVRSITTDGFTMFVFDLADLEGVNRAKLEESLRVPLAELFDRQRTADRARRVLKADFSKLLALFFNTYQTSLGFDFKALGQKLDEKESVFLRHLGKDKVRHLRLLIRLAQVVQEKPKRGLLGVA